MMRDAKADLEYATLVNPSEQTYAKTRDIIEYYINQATKATAEAAADKERIAELEKHCLIVDGACDALGRLVREKDEDRIFYRDKVKALEEKVERVGRNLADGCLLHGILSFYDAHNNTTAGASLLLALRQVVGGEPCTPCQD